MITVHLTEVLQSYWPQILNGKVSNRLATILHLEVARVKFLAPECDFGQGERYRSCIREAKSSRQSEVTPVSFSVAAIVGY